MSFKNAVKLIFTNFRLVWGLLVYLLIIGLGIGGILVGLWYPAFVALGQADYIRQIGELFYSFVNGTATVTLNQLFHSVTDVINEIIGSVLNYPAQIVLTFVLILFVGRLLLGLKDLAVCECVNAQMNANMKISFVEGFFTNFRASWKLVLSRTLFTLPFDAAIFGLMYLANLFCRAIGIGWLAPFFVILVMTVLTPFKKLNFGMWPCFIVADGNRTFSAMRRGIKLAYRFAPRIYSSLVVAHVLSVALNVFFGICTLGVGLLISFPLTVLFESVLNMTILYTHTGRRYYLDEATIFTPPVC